MLDIAKLMLKKNYFIISEVFYALSGALVIFLLMEYFWPGIAQVYINLNYLLLIWLINAILILFKQYD